MRKLLTLMAGVAVIFMFAPGTASAECNLCGDVNGDGAVNPADVVCLIQWFTTFPPISPPCPCACDVNCDNVVNCNVDNWWDTGSDVGYLLAYVYLSGPPPCDPDNNGTPNCDPCN